MVHLIQRAADFGAAPAIVDQSGEHTFTELDRASRRIVGRLSRSLSQPAVSRVALLIPPGFEYVAALWGIWGAGATAVPLCPSHPAPELDYVLRDSGASLAVAGSRQFDLLAGTTANFRTLPVEDLLIPGQDKDPIHPASAAGPALILYTSGSTGRPKGVVLSHANLEAQIRMLISAWDWRPEDRILHTLPLHHTHGLVNALLCPLWCGAVCEFLPRFDPSEVWNRLKGNQVTVFMGVPTMYAKLLGYRRELSGKPGQVPQASCTSLRLMVSGSAALPVALFDDWKATTGQVLLERYGMTEIGMALSNPLSGERRPGFVGQPLPGVQMRRVDEQGDVLDQDEMAGEVEVRGAAVFAEYWGKAEETAAAFRNGWFRTGDMAVIGDGYWKILGRKSVDIIKTGGHKVSAPEVENVLLGHPLIRECAVIGVTDAIWGQRVCAVVAPEKGGKLVLEELRRWSKKRLASYKTPTRLEIVASLPRNAMGKVVKPVLARALAAEGSVSFGEDS